MKLLDLASVRDEIARCMKCGNCQAVCPIYFETKKELGVARGKLTLAQAALEGELPVTPAFAKRLSLCLTCNACVANCPSGVRFDRILLAARAEAVKACGLPPVKKVIFAGLSHHIVFRAGLRSGRLLQPLIFKRHPRKKANYPRFPLGLDRRRIVPPLAARTLLEELPEVNPAIDADRVPNRPARPRMRVAFFTGCMINYIYTEIGRAVVHVLNRNGIEVVLPPEQHCCGIPVFVSGDMVTARAMAASNVRIFSGAQIDAIITACATCGEAWRHHYPELLEGAREAEQARELGKKHYDISEFLVDVIGIAIEPGLVGSASSVGATGSVGSTTGKVTYHDPCHLNRGLGINRAPREILRAIPGVEFKEMADPGRCCGGSGSFSLSYYDLSMDIAAHKVADIRNTGAETVVTGCPACRMQIEDALNRHQMPQRVLHTVELLEMAYQAAEAVEGEVDSAGDADLVNKEERTSAAKAGKKRAG